MSGWSALWVPRLRGAVIFLGPGLLDRLTSISEVRGVDNPAIEDRVFVPLEDLGGAVLPVATVLGNVIFATPEVMSPSTNPFISDVLPRSPLDGSNTLSDPFG